MAAKKYVINIKTYVTDRKKWTIKKYLKKPKTIFIKLKTDPVSAIFAEELLDTKLLKKFKKSKYDIDKLLYKLVNLVDSKSIFNEDKAPTRTDYVEKREIDRSTLYSFHSSFQLLHADVGNLEFLGKEILPSPSLYL